MGVGNMKYTYDFFKESAYYISSFIDFKPEIAIVLGSSLGSLAEEIENPVVIDYKDIPNFLRTTVESHAGKLILGEIAGKKVVCMSGRFHYYEGYDFEQLVSPIRVFKILGVETLILTNAAGAVNTSYNTGEIMIINDHIKLTGASPVRGPNIEAFGPRFFDMSKVYDEAYRELTKKVARDLGIKVNEGIYFYCTGPQFESPAEIRAIRVLGGDAVGMSTVTETITAAHCGIKVLGLSLLTNMAAGVLNQPVTAEEVDETAEKSANYFKMLIRETIRQM